MYNGPFDLKGIIVAIAKHQYIKGLNFESEENRNSYLSNHFNSEEAIDEFHNRSK